MNSIDLLTFDGVFELQGWPPHRIGNKKAVEDGFKGIIWVTKVDVSSRLAEAGQKVIVHPLTSALWVGDYGGVFMDDGGYWIVCDAATMERGHSLPPM